MRRRLHRHLWMPIGYGTERCQRGRRCAMLRVTTITTRGRLHRRLEADLLTELAR